MTLISRYTNMFDAVYFFLFNIYTAVLDFLPRTGESYKKMHSEEKSSTVVWLHLESWTKMYADNCYDEMSLWFMKSCLFLPHNQSGNHGSRQ